MATPLSLNVFQWLMKLAQAYNQVLPDGRWALPDLILCYHDIGFDAWEFTVRPRDFARQISLLKEKFQVVGLPELLSAPGRAGLPRVAITFDDGYLGVYRYAFPILKKHHITAATFITSGHSLNPKTPLPGKFLSTGQIKSLSRSGWQVGYHSHSHPDLTKLSTRALSQELNLHKIRLENRLGLKFTHFAFPYGAYNLSTLDAAFASGWPYLFTVDGGPAFTSQTPHLFHRVTISRLITVPLFVTLLTPAGITLNHLFTRVLRAKDRLFSRASV